MKPLPPAIGRTPSLSLCPTHDHVPSLCGHTHTRRSGVRCAWRVVSVFTATTRGRMKNVIQVRAINSFLSVPRNSVASTGVPTPKTHVSIPMPYAPHPPPNFRRALRARPTTYSERPPQRGAPRRRATVPPAPLARFVVKLSWKLQMAHAKLS